MINIGTNFLYKGELFLDSRQGLAKTKEDLRNWSIPVPDGFEVYLDLENDPSWYTYNSKNSIDGETGKFRKRIDDDRTDREIQNINNEIISIEAEILSLQSETQNINSEIGYIESQLSSLQSDKLFEDLHPGDNLNNIFSGKWRLTTPLINPTEYIIGLPKDPSIKYSRFSLFTLPMYGDWSKRIMQILISDGSNVPNYNIILFRCSKSNGVHDSSGWGNWYNLKVIDYNSAMALTKGTTLERPTNSMSEDTAGFQYYDIDLRKYICWSGREWTNLDGTSLS